MVNVNMYIIQYRERRVKTILYHDNEDGIIAYTMNRTFHFEQFEKFTENDTIMTINFVYVVRKCGPLNINIVLFTM